MHSIYSMPWHVMEGQPDKIHKKIKPKKTKHNFRASVLVVDDEPRARASMKAI